MRWHSPETGERRIRRVFLWLPLKLGSETRWFEHAVIEEEFGYRWADYGHAWRVVRFIPDDAPETEWDGR